MAAKRVVITGMGVVAPNAIGINDFNQAIYSGKSGIKFIPNLEALGLACHVGGIPAINLEGNDLLPDHFTNKVEASNLIYGILAGLEAWNMANLPVNQQVDWESGVAMGLQSNDGNFVKKIIDKIYSNNLRKLGGRTAEQSITSSLSAYLSGYLGLGNCCLSNSSACATGSEAILIGYKRIKNGEAKRMLVGSSEGNSPMIWAGLDHIKALTASCNQHPETASKPMSAQAKGLVPGCGAGALVLEEYDSAIGRNATIYAEIVGGAENCGGQRNGGTMTKPNLDGMRHCIETALNNSEIDSNEIDLISGHLTGTYADPGEVSVWADVLNRENHLFPYINSLKSMTGHCLAAAGSIESVAVVLQLYHDYVHPSINCEEVHPHILNYITTDRIPTTAIHKPMSHAVKASFGFGDINCCLIFKNYYYGKC